MARIKIKTKDKNPRRRDKLLEILAQHDVFATNIFEARDGYSLTIHKSHEQDIIFGEECQAALTINDFSSVIPSELKSKRTILMFNCPDEITRHDNSAIAKEIERVNSFTENKIELVSKFTNKPIVKIIFKQACAAQKAQESGIRLFNMSIPSHQIEEEEYVPITTCMRCYAMEKHFTSQCTKDKNYQLCSECGKDGHKWFACSADPREPKNCINCHGNHSTLAFKCPERKKIEKAKKEETKAKKDLTYSTATTKNLKPNMLTSNNTNNNQVTTDSSHKILTCIYLAHVYNVEHPDTYEDALNAYLVSNNLPEVKVPLVPNSRAILNLPFTPPTPPAQSSNNPTPTPNTQTTPNSKTSPTPQTTPISQTPSPQEQIIEEENEEEDEEYEESETDNCQDEEIDIENEPEDNEEDQRSASTDTTHSSPTNSNNSQDSPTHTTPTSTSHTSKISQDSSTHSTPTNTSHTSNAQEIKTTPLSKNTPPLQQRLRKTNKKKWRK